jgi:lantibiotic modifying enzyme
MKMWKKVMDEAMQEKALEAIADINNALNLDLLTNQSVSLIDGLSGHLVFKSYYNFILGTKDVRELEIIAERLFELIGTKPLEGSLMYGLSGIGLSMYFANNRLPFLDEDIFSEFDDYIIQFIKKNISYSNFDFFNGYLGECLYLLRNEKLSDSRSKLTFSEILNALEVTSIKRNRGIGWFWARNISYLHPQITDVNKIPKDFNLGMAHGIPGIISVLNIIATKHPEFRNANKLIDKAVTYMLSEMQLNEYGYFFKHYSGQSSNIYPSRLSWCYSDLGISIMFLNLYKKTNDTKYLNLSTKIAGQTLKVPFERTIVRDGGLCHGAAGIAHIYNRLYQSTGLLYFRDAALNWYEILLNKYYQKGKVDQSFLAYGHITVTNKKEYQKNLGLLNGLVGIGLSLLAGLSDIEPEWDRCLLLS